MRQFFAAIGLVAGILLGQPAQAGPFEDGLAAHDAGQYERALELLRPLAEAGDVEAQNRLSHMYWYGEGVAADYAEALRWSRRAAEAGSAHAQFDIGVHYMSGLGVERDPAVAFEWFKKAAEQGDAGAAFNLSIMYVSGTGVAQDLAQWDLWLKRAAGHGSAKAQLVLARTQMLLADTPAAVGETDRLLQAAASELSEEAQYVLGSLFLEGDAGWQKDASQAYFWLSLARQFGCLEAPARLRVAAAQLSPAEVVAAEDLAAQWRELHPVPAGRVHPVKLQSCEVAEQVNG